MSESYQHVVKGPEANGVSAAGGVKNRAEEEEER